MTFESDIAFLEKFRGFIERFLIVGTAPTMDPLWGGSGLIRMQEAMQNPEFRALRRDINQMKGRAALVLEGLDIGSTFHQYPPPAVGGPIEKFPLFDLITDNRSHHTIDGTVFTDKLDEAIGLLRNKAAQNEAQPAALGPASPFFIVSDLNRSLEFYEQNLGFECRHKEPDDDAFFAIVGHGSAQIMLKAIGPEAPPLPNPVRHEWAAWDVFIYCADPDALVADFLTRGTVLRVPLADREDGLRGFETTDPDGYVLFFGRPTSV